MATPIELSYTYQDEMGVTATSMVHANADGAVETIDGLVGEWNSLGGLLDATTGAIIVGGEVRIPLSRYLGGIGGIGAWKGTAVAGSRVEQTALVNFGVAETKYKAGIPVPAVLDSLIAGGKLIVASGALDTLVNALISGFTNGNFTNAAGQGLVSAVDAILSFRKHRKQLNRVSFETPG